MIDPARLRAAIEVIKTAAQHCELSDRWRPPDFYAAEAIKFLSAPEPGQYELQQGALMTCLALATIIRAAHAPANGAPGLTPLPRRRLSTRAQRLASVMRALSEKRQPETRPDDHRAEDDAGSLPRDQPPTW